MNYQLLEEMQKKMGLNKVAYVPPQEVQDQMQQQAMQEQMEPPPDIKGMAQQEVDQMKMDMQIPPEERLLRLEKQVDILTQFMQDIIMGQQQEQMQMMSEPKMGSYRGDDLPYYRAALEGLRYV